MSRWWGRRRQPVDTRPFIVQMHVMQRQPDGSYERCSSLAPRHVEGEEAAKLLQARLYSGNHWGGATHFPQVSVTPADPATA